MPARSIDLELPSSYSTLPFKEIRLSHCPASSVEPTPIVVLTLYRPNNYNAFTDTMMEEIEHAYALFSVDPRVKCIVMTGHGKMYCAGADLQVGFKTMDAETEIEHRDGYVSGNVHTRIMLNVVIQRWQSDSCYPSMH